MNRILLTVIVLLLLLACISLFFPFVVEAEAWITVAEIMCMMVMLINGTFKKSVFYKFFTASIFVFILGVLFKILHLTGADQLMALPYFFIPLAYALYFIRKKSKDHLSVMKLLAVLFFFIPVALSDFALISDDVADILFLVGHIVFWLAFADFIVVGFRGRTLFNR
jgi:hypothetical protein